MIRPIHPFPARMAPELAINSLVRLNPNSIVLDPMAGSGTVVRHASELGFQSIGFDMDPLSVLMARAWTTEVIDEEIERLAVDVISEARDMRAAAVSLPWIDDDAETSGFVRYWFGAKQRAVLRKIAHVLNRRGKTRIRASTRAALDVIKIGLSRIIITKDQGASLARDVSHSRPHKVVDISDFDVLLAFERSVSQVRRLLLAAPPKGGVRVSFGDARALTSVANRSVDAVLTSPPYLNAIDYMRGHRVALVWLGYSLAELRAIRSNSIGAERGPGVVGADLFESICSSMCEMEDLSARHQGMVTRYAQDIYRLMSEISRAVRPGGAVTLVVGNSCLKGAFIRNSNGVAMAGAMVGLRLSAEVERLLPDRNRYLPMSSGPLDKRMRTETILTLTCL
jgi:SAM-dependent methyltransferase